jgi:HTH-type transcriptional regulator, bacterioopsin transcriptional activator and related proteins
MEQYMMGGAGGDYEQQQAPTAAQQLSHLLAQVVELQSALSAERHRADLYELELQTLRSALAAPRAKAVTAHLAVVAAATTSADAAPGAAPASAAAPGTAPALAAAAAAAAPAAAAAAPAAAAATSMGLMMPQCQQQPAEAAAPRPSELAMLLLKERVLDAAKEGITIADCSLPDMPLIYVNAGFCRMTGYTAADVVGKNCRFLQVGRV